MTKEQIEKLGITYKEGITDDEVFAELEKKHTEHATLKSEYDKTKGLLSTRNSEIKSLKDQIDANKSDDEKEKEKINLILKENEELKKTNRISKITNQYVGQYGEELAMKIANAYVDGKDDDVAKYIAEGNKTNATKHEAEWLKNYQDPNAKGKTNSQYTKEGFKKGEYSMEELNKLYNENKALYDEITK